MFSVWSSAPGKHRPCPKLHFAPRLRPAWENFEKPLALHRDEWVILLQEASIETQKGSNDVKGICLKLKQHPKLQTEHFFWGSKQTTKVRGPSGQVRLKHPVTILLSLPNSGTTWIMTVLSSMALDHLWLELRLIWVLSSRRNRFNMIQLYSCKSIGFM